MGLVCQADVSSVADGCSSDHIISFAPLSSVHDKGSKSLAAPANKVQAPPMGEHQQLK